MEDRVAPVVPQWRGVLGHIHVAPYASQPMQALENCTVVAGLGIPEDRYATRKGTYSERHHIDRQITLIESETLDALSRDHQVTVAPNEHRRNLTTIGVPVSHLVGQYFSVGECVLYGGRLNVPCKYLEQLLDRRVFRPLIHRSGLNARVIIGGVIAVGDAIEPCDATHIDPTLRTENETHALEVPPEVF